MSGDSPGTGFTIRDVFAAIERVDGRIEQLRKDTSDARHKQNNDWQRALGEVTTKLGAIDVTLASTLPATLGPRINELERWQSRSDGESDLPRRLTGIEQAIDEIRDADMRREARRDGEMRVIKGAVAVVSLLSTGLGVVATWIAIQP